MGGDISKLVRQVEQKVCPQGKFIGMLLGVENPYRQVGQSIIILNYYIYSNQFLLEI